LNPPDPLAPPENGNGPVFDEPWHAQVLALADALVRAEFFTARQWAEALGAARARAEARAAPDTAETYYLCAIETLEGLVARETAISLEALGARRRAWERAYLATPHGQPVMLGAGEK